MTHLFVYGSLMFPEVWRRVTGGSHAALPARLAGYRRLGVKGERYPGLLRAPGHSVEGVVRLDVGDAELRRLDRFEGKDYKRVPVRVETGDGRSLAAETYVFRNRFRHRLGGEWDAERFRKRDLRRFMARYAGFRG